MAGGRPTDYTSDVPSRVEKYLTQCAENKELPTVEGLAVYLEVRRSTIYEWRDAHEEFSDILERLLAKQANKLIQGGLTNTYNATITKLILTKHDYRDKVDNDVTTGGDKINFNVVNYGDTATAPLHSEALPDTPAKSA